MKAHFIEPMECVPVQRLPNIAGWTNEIKLDGYRLEAVRLRDRVELYSRQGKAMNAQFPEIAKDMESLPPETVVDGELTALDDQGRPSFNLLQKYRSSSAPLMYFVFDILVYKGRDLTRLPLSERRSILRTTIKPHEHVAIAEWTESLESVESFARARNLG